MDLGNPWILLSGVLIGAVGFVMFNYGRKEQDLRALGAGLAMCVYPYFIGSVILMWLIFAAICGGMYALSKYA